MRKNGLIRKEMYIKSGPFVGRFLLLLGHYHLNSANKTVPPVIIHPATQAQVSRRMIRSALANAISWTKNGTVAIGSFS